MTEQQHTPACYTFAERLWSRDSSGLCVRTHISTDVYVIVSEIAPAAIHVRVCSFDSGFIDGLINDKRSEVQKSN
jgi:hypothetical protein